jgi:hypothetical protein
VTVSSGCLAVLQPRIDCPQLEYKPFVSLRVDTLLANDSTERALVLPSALASFVVYSGSPVTLIPVYGPFPRQCSLAERILPFVDRRTAALRGPLRLVAIHRITLSSTLFQSHPCRTRWQFSYYSTSHSLSSGDYDVLIQSSMSHKGHTIFRQRSIFQVTTAIILVHVMSTAARSGRLKRADVEQARPTLHPCSARTITDIIGIFPTT